MNKIKLFCFPYAGGSAFIYNTWKKLLDASIELKAIELAGRGTRINDPFYPSFDVMIDDVFGAIKYDLSQGHYALFGHSLGTLICYQLIERIKEEGLPKPKHVFFSGRGAPHVPNENEKMYHLMDAEELKREVVSMGGKAREFFEYPELMELFLPVLKQDFKMSNAFKAKSEICRYDGDITVFLGKEDESTAKQNDGWKDYTSQLCQLNYFKGGHFFIHDEMEKIVSLINLELLK